MTLLGPNGQPISSKTYQNKKAPPPRTGPSYGAWAGEDIHFLSLPGGGAIQFDLSQLSFGDFRQMREHYQVNSSLTVLTFLMHQMEWDIVIDGNKDQRDFYHEQIENQWNQIVRAHATSFWAGYGSNAIEYDNDTTGRRFVISKIKDLPPEDCRVRWKKVDGAGNQKFSIFDGINQWGAEPIPVTNSYWYPLLMEHGNYYGTKLLKPAFQPWFFSILLHLFANRYYERFGEPTPIGRAPYEDDVKYGGENMTGDQAMELILQSLRSRASVVLPDSRTPIGNETNPQFDYQIEYLESQMRGADFERYMTRLDEEISLALFTPILLLRTADVGSYNLGTQHSIIYQWMLNAMSGDWAGYINKYLLRPLRDFNFGLNAPQPKIKFRKMGRQNQTLIDALTTSLVAKGSVKPNTEELGEMAGMTLTDVQQVTAAPAAPADPNVDPNQPDPAQQNDSQNSGSNQNVRSVVERMCTRIQDQVTSAYRRNKINNNLEFSLGYQRQFEEALTYSGIPQAYWTTKDFYAKVTMVLGEMCEIADRTYPTPEDFMTGFKAAIFDEVDRLAA